MFDFLIRGLRGETLTLGEGGGEVGMCVETGLRYHITLHVQYFTLATQFSPS